MLSTRNIRKINKQKEKFIPDWRVNTLKRILNIPLPLTLLSVNPNAIFE